MVEKTDFHNDHWAHKIERDCEIKVDQTPTHSFDNISLYGDDATLTSKNPDIEHNVLVTGYDNIHVSRKATFKEVLEAMLLCNCNGGDEEWDAYAERLWDEGQEVMQKIESLLGTLTPEQLVKKVFSSLYGYTNTYNKTFTLWVDDKGGVTFDEK